MIVNFAWYFDTRVGLYNNLELVASRLTVLTLIITSLDDELNWLVDCLVFKKSRAEAKGLQRSGVEEVSVRYKGCGEFVTKN